MEILAAAVGAVLGGALVGAVLRAVLARLRRGAVVGVGRCEAAVALAWAPPAIGGATGGVSWSWIPAWAAIGVLGVAGTATDVAHRRLPDAVTLPALPVLLASLLPRGGAAVLAAVLGAAIFLGAHAAVHLLAPRALGAGDVKLAAALGAPLAAGSWWAMLAAPVLAALGVIVAVMITRQREVPFGPPMLGATWVLVGVAAITVIP